MYTYAKPHNSTSKIILSKSYPILYHFKIKENILFSIATYGLYMYTFIILFVSVNLHVHEDFIIEIGKWHPEATMKVYKDFRVKLIKSLPMNDSLFLEKLKSQSLLPGDLNEEIQSRNTTAKKSACFLDNVIDRSLSINNFEFLYKLLFVMSDEKDIKNDLLKQLSAEMQEELHKESSLITKNETG